MVLKLRRVVMNSWKVFVVIGVIVFGMSSSSMGYFARYAGSNDDGQGGVGDKYQKHFFEQMLLTNKIKKVASGANHMLMMFSSGGIASVGRNTSGNWG